MNPIWRVLVWNPNPTLDVVSELSELRVGEVQAAEAQTFSAGGKGTLVMRALSALGTDYEGATPLGGPSGRLVEQLMRQEGLSTEFAEVDGVTRAAVTIVERNGRNETNVNGPGPVTGNERWRSHVGRIEARVASGDLDLFVVAGRPPTDASTAEVANLCRLATSVGTRVAVDLSVPFLGPILEVARPWLVRINRAEASACLANSIGRAVSNKMDELIDGLLVMGAENVVLTDGADPFGGLLLGLRFKGTPPSIRLRSAIGCGDCFLAGLISALSSRPNEPLLAVRWAVAVAAASAEDLRPGYVVVQRAEELLPSVRILGG